MVVDGSSKVEKAETGKKRKGPSTPKEKEKVESESLTGTQNTHTLTHLQHFNINSIPLISINLLQERKRKSELSVLKKQQTPPPPQPPPPPLLLGPAAYYQLKVSTLTVHFLSYIGLNLGQLHGKVAV